MRIAYNELSNYNNGTLVFNWFDLDNVTKEEHAEELQAWLDSLPLVNGYKCEEWCVGDVDDVPRSMVSDFGLSDEFWQYKEAQESSSYDWEVFVAAMDLDIPPEMVEDTYQGEFDSDRDFALDFAEQCDLLSEQSNWPYTCIDWDHAARELMFDYGASSRHYFRTTY